MGRESDNRREQRTLREVLRSGEAYLAQHGIADASVDAWLLLEHVTGLTRAQYLARASEPAEALLVALKSAETGSAVFGSAASECAEVLPAVLESAEEVPAALGFITDPDGTASVNRASVQNPALCVQEISTESAKTAEEWLHRYQELLVRRGEHIPLQHLTGEQEFMGLPFLVNEHVLIPRQDTETLVEESLARLRPGMRVLDLCTGSGCIAVSLAKLGPEYCVRQIAANRAGDAETLRQCRTDVGMSERKRLENTGEILVDGSDLSSEALTVARENARRLGVRVRFFESDLFAGIPGTYDMIVSNPPYIRTSVIGELSEEVRLHEPRLALDGSEDGLCFYREIVRQSPAHLGDGGWLFFEIGYDQAEAVSGLMAAAGFAEITVIRDLAGHDRVIRGRYAK